VLGEQGLQLLLRRIFRHLRSRAGRHGRLLSLSPAVRVCARRQVQGVQVLLQAHPPTSTLSSCSLRFICPDVMCFGFVGADEDSLPDDGRDARSNSLCALTCSSAAVASDSDLDVRAEMSCSSAAAL
jgi:hypothetical protein